MTENGELAKSMSAAMSHVLEPRRVPQTGRELESNCGRWAGPPRLGAARRL